MRLAPLALLLMSCGSPLDGVHTLTSDYCETRDDCADGEMCLLELDRDGFGQCRQLCQRDRDCPIATCCQMSRYLPGGACTLPGVVCE